MVNKSKTYIKLLFNFFGYKIESKHYKKKYNLKDYAIIRSKKNGSVCLIMRENIFDYISYPRSLFVDYVKTPSIENLVS